MFHPTLSKTIQEHGINGLLCIMFFLLLGILPETVRNNVLAGRESGDHEQKGMPHVLSRQHLFAVAITEGGGGGRF